MTDELQTLVLAGLRAKAQALFADEAFWRGRPMVGMFAKEERALIHEVTHCITLGKRNGFDPHDGVDVLVTCGARAFSRWLFEQHAAFTGEALVWNDEKCCAANESDSFWLASDNDEIEATGLSLAVLERCGESDIKAVALDSATGVNSYIADYADRAVAARKHWSESDIDSVLSLTHGLLARVI